MDAVHFELLFQVHVELGKSFERQFLHHVDSLASGGVGLQKLLGGLGKSGRKQEDLARGGQVSDESLDLGLEVLGKQLVGLVHDEHLALLELNVRDHAQYFQGSPYNNMDRLFESKKRLVGRLAPCQHDAFDIHVLSDVLDFFGGLVREFPRGREHQRLDDWLGCVDFLEKRDDIGGGFARSVFRSVNNVFPCQGDWDDGLLDGRRSIEALFVESFEDVLFNVEIVESESPCVGHVLNLEIREHCLCSAWLSPKSPCSLS